jgi:hypothetical protein
MEDLEFHKGEPCPYKDNTQCAEGYCIRCAIYEEKQINKLVSR